MTIYNSDRPVDYKPPQHDPPPTPQPPDTRRAMYQRGHADGRLEAFREAVRLLKLRASEYRNDDADRWLELATMQEAVEIIEQAAAKEK